MDYISLKDATKYCNYSQDYLKLRARQGKLKAVKIGRNWVTTKDWVEEYIAGVAPLSRATGCSAKRSNLRSKLGSKLGWRTVLLVIVILTIIGIFINVGIFAEYLQWQTANISGVFDEVLEIIPGKVIEVK